MVPVQCGNASVSVSLPHWTGTMLFKTVTLGLSGHSRDRISLLADLPPTRWLSAEQHRPSPACVGPVCSQIPASVLRDDSRPLALWLRPGVPIASVVFHQ